jgi:hypothetical protein
LVKHSQQRGLRQVDCRVSERVGLVGERREVQRFQIGPEGRQRGVHRLGMTSLREQQR